MLLMESRSQIHILVARLVEKIEYLAFLDFRKEDEFYLLILGISQIWQMYLSAGYQK